MGGVWAHYLDAVEVVHCKHCAALVLVAEKGKALGLARGLVTHQVDVDNLTIPVCQQKQTLQVTPSPKLCQNWLNATEGALFIFAQLITDAASTLQKVWALIRLWKQHRIQARIYYINMRHVRPRLKKRIPSRFKQFWFIFAGVRNASGYWRNAWYNLSCPLQIYCHFSTIKKMSGSWQFFKTYGVINYGSGSYSLSLKCQPDIWGH